MELAVLTTLTLVVAVCNAKPHMLYFGKSMPIRSYLTLYRVTFPECVESCAVRRRCQSVDFQRRFQQCDLNLFVDEERYAFRVRRGSVHTRLREYSQLNNKLECGASFCVQREACAQITNQCGLTDCGELEDVANGYMEGRVKTIGAKRMAYCNDGALIPIKQRVPVQTECQANGEWSSTGIQCLQRSDVCSTYLIKGEQKVEVRIYLGLPNRSDLLIVRDVGFVWFLPPSYTFLKVEFLNVAAVLVMGISTQWKTFGGEDVHFSLYYSETCEDDARAPVTDSNGEKRFVGQATDDPVITMFDAPIRVLCFYIHEVESAALSFDVLGCVSDILFKYRTYNRP